MQFFKRSAKTSGSSNKDSHSYSENDLRNYPEWNSNNLWLCDIEEKAGEGEADNDFLFLASITGDGDSHKTTDKGRCVFQDCMYDIQSFEEDSTYDGKLDFGIWFGKNTKERKDTPNGWSIQFKDLVFSDNKYTGKIVTSWWGERRVTLINYGSLSEQERFTDLVVPKRNYYKTIS